MQVYQQHTRFDRNWFLSRLGWLAMGNINTPPRRPEKPGFKISPSLQNEHFMSKNPRPLTADAAEKIKAMAHPQRFAIMAALVDGPKSVGELVELMDMRQPAVSQMLARLRESGLVKSQRAGKQVFYSTTDSQTIKMVMVLGNRFIT